MMMHSETTGDQHICLPAERFYWARLNVNHLGQSRRLKPRTLGYLLEVVMPVPIEDVHAVFVRLDNTTVIACAMAQTALSEYRNMGVLVLTPAAVPNFLSANLEAHRFNLLTGSFAPPAIRLLQGQMIAGLVAAVLVVAALLIVGTERRIGSIQEYAAAVDAQHDEVAERIFGPDALASTQPFTLRLTAELRSLRPTRDVHTESVTEPDAAVALSALLAHWPAELETQVSSISVAPQLITVQVALPNAGAVQTLADALSPMPGWELRQPRINSSGENVRATLQLVQRAPPVSEGGT